MGAYLTIHRYTSHLMLPTRQHQRALLLGRQRAARTDSSPRPPSASPPPPTLGGLEKKEEDGMEEAYAAAEAEAAAAVDPEIAALRICFAFRPLSAALAVAAAAAAGAEGGGAGGGGGGGGERWVLPSVGDRKLFRTTAGATVRGWVNWVRGWWDRHRPYPSIDSSASPLHLTLNTITPKQVAALKRLLARRLALARPSHLELCLVLPAPVPAPTTTVVVLDDALTLAEAVTEVWTVGGDVGEELVLHYCLRGPERRGVGLDCEG